MKLLGQIQRDLDYQMVILADLHKNSIKQNVVFYSREMSQLDLGYIYRQSSFLMPFFYNKIIGSISLSGMLQYIRIISINLLVTTHNSFALKIVILAGKNFN